MRSLMRIGIHNAGIVDLIDTHFSRRVNDLLLVEQYAHMRDLSFIIIEKGEVADAPIGRVDDFRLAKPQTVISNPVIRN